MPLIRNLVFTIALILCMFVTPSWAQASAQLDYKQTPIEKNFVDLISLASCVIYGGSNQNGPCFGDNSASQGGIGLLGFGYGATDIFWNTPPLSTSQYVASVTQKFNPVQEVSAQVGGSGSTVISTIFIFWESARNVSYVVMTLIFIVVGMMILLGRKSGGQSVLSVQSALPGLVVSLIMITFSYFLAALITDIAFYGCYLIAYIFRSVLGVSSADPGVILGTQNLIQIFSGFIFNGDNYWNIVSFIYSISDSDVTVNLAIRGAGAGIGYLLTGWVGGAVGSFIPGGNFGEAGRMLVGVFSGAQVMNTPRMPEFLVGTLVYIVLGVALVLALFKLLIDLTKRYLTILFLTIFAPFIFLFSAMPGNNKGYESWIKNMLCNALAFPAVFGAFYFAAYFLVGRSMFEISGRTIEQAVMTLPNIPLPLVQGLPAFQIPGASFNIPTFGTVATLPLFGGFNLGIINQVIGYGILLATPAIPDFLCKLLGAKLDDVFGKEITGSLNTSRTRTFGYGRNAAGNIGNASAKTSSIVNTLRGRGASTTPPPTSGPVR